jgi:hypothetical protein
MSTLSKELRRQLENTVLKAREEAERGAAAALEELGLTETKIPTHLNEGQQKLRRRLRAHGKQVGDTQISDKVWDISHLIHECAYEHWHRMLFARFLAENGFLIEPESGLDVDFAHCEDEGKRLGIDPWEVAAGYAQKMLLDIFRNDDSVLQLRLPRETRNALTALLTSLPREVFLASDSLGWVYQFWQAKKKEDVNASGVKIGADELPSVTQLFTEDYMVDFLLDNTLGAWHAGKVFAANPKLAESAKSEDELRQAVALPGCPWKYLRFIKGEDGKWTPAAGTFDGWPKSAAALRVLDPCMGSGHFVVAMFERLVALRVAEEKLDEAAAVAAVIRDNLFGLEIDPRCTQIGAFNLALAAWRRVGHCKLPAMNLACSGLAPNTREADWLAIAGDNQKLQRGMERLYRLFQKAAVLGSLINPRAGEGDLLVAAFHELQPLLEKALAQETKDDTAHEMAVTARGLAKAAEILAGQFTLVATNVPYLGRGKQDEVLKDYCELTHSKAKADLSTCFVERSLNFCSPSGSITLVTPQNWWFLSSYADYRKFFLENESLHFLATLGEEAWQSFGDRGPMAALIIGDRKPPVSGHTMAALDALPRRSITEKIVELENGKIRMISQAGQYTNPDHRITVDEPISGALLQKYATAYVGLQNGDVPRYILQTWELTPVAGAWEFFQMAANQSADWLGRDAVIRWEKGAGSLSESDGARVQGLEAWGKKGILVTRMRKLGSTHYSGHPFDQSSAALIPKDPVLLPAIWAFLSSDIYVTEVRRLDKKVNVTPATLVKVPFDLAHWQKVAAEKYPHGLPKPFSSDPTQWLFTGCPQGSDHPLQVAVARLVGYRWPRQTGSNFPDCPSLGPDGLENHADKDGVVCFSQARDEAPAAERLRALLADAYGKEWSHAMERKLIAATGSKADSLEDWLVNDFFAQHCDLFHNRPFVWHIWDGRKDGFNVLVNYHKLAGPDGVGARTLETLTYAYLGDWIGRQKDAVAHDEAGAEDRLAAAQELQSELKKISAGEPPHDLFIRWKPLHQQSLGWQPDFNDGVRLNIRPFMATNLSRGKKGCGLFRSKPGSSVKWEKDRGKEPKRPKEDFPWFWKWDEQTVDFVGNGEFDGNRWNDCHYTTAFKKAARERKERKG